MNVKKFLMIGCLVVTFFILGACSSEKQTTKTPEQQFIDERDKVLDQLAEQEPEKLVVAQVAFDNFLRSDDVGSKINFLESYKILYIYYGSPTGFGGGGYTPSNDENSLEKSIEKLKNNQVEYLSRQINLESV